MARLCRLTEILRKHKIWSKMFENIFLELQIVSTRTLELYTNSLKQLFSYYTVEKHFWQFILPVDRFFVDLFTENVVWSTPKYFTFCCRYKSGIYLFSLHRINMIKEIIFVLRSISYR